MIREFDWFDLTDKSFFMSCVCMWLLNLNHGCGTRYNEQIAKQLKFFKYKTVCDSKVNFKLAIVIGHRK